MFFKQINSYLNKESIFLIDGIGALMSFIMLIVCFIGFQPYFGLPLPLVYKLALLPLLFSVYSLSIHFIKPVNWKKYLVGIALPNLVYCLLTIIIMIYYSEQITWLGIGYFVIEKMIIIALVVKELKLTKNI